MDKLIVGDKEYILGLEWLGQYSFRKVGDKHELRISSFAGPDDIFISVIEKFYTDIRFSPAIRAEYGLWKFVFGGGKVSVKVAKEIRDVYIDGNWKESEEVCRFFEAVIPLEPITDDTIN